MIDSQIFVTVRSRLTGRKFFTPEIRFSKLAPTPVSLSEEVRRDEMAEKPRKSSVDAEAWAGVWVWVVVIIVMRVVARTLRWWLDMLEEHDVCDIKIRGRSLLFDISERGGVRSSSFQGFLKLL